MEVELQQQQQKNKGSIKRKFSYFWFTATYSYFFHYSITKKQGKLFRPSTFYFMLASYVYTKAKEIFILSTNITINFYIININWCSERSGKTRQNTFEYIVARHNAFFINAFLDP